MPDWLTWDWFWQWLGRAADVVSLVAIPYAALKVRLIARRVVFRVRAADIVVKISDEVKSLRAVALNLPDEFRDAQSSVRRCLERAQIFANQSGPAEKRAVAEMKRLKEKLDQIDASKDHEALADVVWKFVEAAEGFLVHAEEAEENRRVGGADVD